MLIIVEGPDGTGKSTLVTQLERRIQERYPDDFVRVYRKGAPKKHPLDEYEEQIIPYRPGRNEHIICDRWHLGELVYPKIFDRKSEMTMGVFDHIEMLLESRGALLIHSRRLDVDDHIEQLMERDDLDVNPEMIPSIRSGFRYALGASRLFHYDHDYANCSFSNANDCADSFILAAERLDKKAAELNEFVTYVGPTNPRVLILGDVRHNTDPGTNTSLLPAFMPYRGTSGHYLLEALRDTNEDLRHIGLANANDVDNPVRMWHRLGDPAVIALGRNASQNLHIPHSSVPHPQFIRRFHNAARAAYGNLLSTAALETGDYSTWRP